MLSPDSKWKAFESHISRGHKFRKMKNCVIFDTCHIDPNNSVKDVRRKTLKNYKYTYKNTYMCIF